MCTGVVSGVAGGGFGRRLCGGSGGLRRRGRRGIGAAWRRRLGSGLLGVAGVGLGAHGDGGGFGSGKAPVAANFGAPKNKRIASRKPQGRGEEEKAS